MQKAKRFAIVTGSIVGIIIVLGIILAAIFGRLPELLDCCLIVLALLLIAGTIYQLYSVYKIVRTIKTVQAEMKPLLSSVNDTLGIVKNTAQTAGNTVSTISNATRLTSEVVLAPGIRAVASVVAVQEMARVFVGKGHAKSRADERRKQQMEAMAAAQANAADGGGN
jgi:hypothetical protein